MKTVQLKAKSVLLISLNFLHSNINIEKIKSKKKCKKILILCLDAHKVIISFFSITNPKKSAKKRA